MTEFVPETEEAVAEIVRDAARDVKTFDICGQSTRGVMRRSEDVLSTRALTGITLYEPGALTLVARAGTPIFEIEAALAAEGQHLAFEPWHLSALSSADASPTLGGMVALNVSGPRRLQAGACRDAMIGVRFVDGTGAICKNGGRVMKNVTGLDLVKLMTGSRGTLGVLTEVGLKVLPRPKATASVVFDGLPIPQAVEAMTRAMTQPFDVTGAAHLPKPVRDTPQTLLRLEGDAESVDARAAKLRDALSGFGTARIETGAEVWADIRDCNVLNPAAEDCLWRISVRPTDGPRVAERLGDAKMYFDWSGGLIWAVLPQDRDARAALSGLSGHATLLRGPEKALAHWGMFQPDPPMIAELSSGLRAKFDPHQVFSPREAVFPENAAG